MNRSLPKTFVISIVSLVLLYYSTVWAVLRCVHDVNHSEHFIALGDSGELGNNAYRSASSHTETHIDCLNRAYHTESLAGPSSSPQLQRWVTETDFRVADFLTSPSVTGDWTRDPWLRFAFVRPPGLRFLIDSPLYLSFSILRI
jgi:hypothetical protein